MQLTGEELKAAALADSHTYASHRGRVRELRLKGKHREANALQIDYESRLGRWIKTIEEIKEQCPQNQ